MRRSPRVPRKGHAGFLGRLLGAALFLVLPHSFASPPSPDAPAIVFSSREFDTLPEPRLRANAVERARHGRLRVREPNGGLRTLVDAFVEGAGPDTPIDVIDPSVSYDGTRIVFSGYSLLEEAWRIYEVRADGSSLRQLTRSDRRMDLSRYGEMAGEFERYDDVDPCYLPDGRICFVSSRYPGIAPAGRIRATNLFVSSADGGDVHRITSERFGGETPAVDPQTGKIVYSRWWLTVPGELPTPQAPPTPGPLPYHGPPPPSIPSTNEILRGIEPSSFAGVNSWFLSSVRPDGSEGGAMFSGFGLDRELTMAWRPSFGPDGTILGLFLTAPPFLGSPGEHGLRALRRGPALPEALGGPQSFDGSASMPDPNPAVPPAPFETPRLIYHSAELLPDGRILATGYQPGTSKNDEGLPDYDIFVQEIGSKEAERLFGESSSSELDAVPLVSRERPPVLPDVAPRLYEGEAPSTVSEAIARNGSFRFLVENIFMNAPVDVPIATAPPVGDHLRIEFYMNPQRDGADSPRPPILIRRMDVPASGRIEMTLPAGVPLFEVLRLPNEDIAVGRDGQVFHVGGMNYGVAGRIARCVGCHAGHSQMEIPADPVWANVAPSAVVSASSTATSVAGRAVPEGSLLPAKLVDRRRDLVGGEWAARTTDSSPWVALRWSDTPVQAAEAVVYGAQAGEGLYRTRSLSIRGFTIELLRGNASLWRQTTDEPIRPGGTRVPLDMDLSFDELRLSFPRDHVHGMYEGVRSQAAIAEIEVLGRVGSITETFGLIRGDADCNARLDLNDPISLLAFLFLGKSLCCEEAADIDLSGDLDISDVSYHLHWQFLGGTAPAEPWPDCGRVPSSRKLDCDRQTCP